jgi:hypothetical protein
VRADDAAVTGRGVAATQLHWSAVTLPRWRRFRSAGALWFRSLNPCKLLQPHQSYQPSGAAPRVVGEDQVAGLGMNLALQTNSCKNVYAICCIHVENNMDFLRTIKHLVEENDTAIAATQQAIMRVDFLLSRTFQKDAIPSESTSQELALLFQERR